MDSHRARDELIHILTKRCEKYENEIAELREQLEEARRQYPSSPSQ